jgi:hypothetical protein
MASFRLSYFWRSRDDEGWSENFFVTAADIVAAQTQLDALLALLLPLRSSDYTMDYARCSNVAVKGDSLPTTVTLPAPGTYTIPTNEYRLEANSAVLVLIYADPTTKGHWFCRGVTSAQIKGRELQTESTFDTAMAAVLSSLAGGSFLVRSVNTPGPPPTYIYTAVTAASVLRASARKPGRPFVRVRGRR